MVMVELVSAIQKKWRREWDSNPRFRGYRNTRFPVVPLRPTRASLRISGFQLSAISNNFLHSPSYMFVFAMAFLLATDNYIMAERVGFEPTCPALHRTNRFRVDPVTTTSVPLRSITGTNAKLIVSNVPEVRNLFSV